MSEEKIIYDELEENYYKLYQAYADLKAENERLREALQENINRSCQQCRASEIARQALEDL